jgi:hypothetical protein
VAASELDRPCQLATRENKEQGDTYVLVVVAVVRVDERNPERRASRTSNDETFNEPDD